MLAGPALTLLLLSAEPARAASPESLAARAELEMCAERIEELKARHEAGRELERLLRRAQQLAGELERAAAEAPRPPAMPSPEELRERADAARDEVDRLAAEISALDVRIQDVRRGRSEPGGPVARAALGSAPSGGDQLRALLAERAAFVEQRARARSEAARLDAEARAAERDR